jgi:hypothetical protein
MHQICSSRNVKAQFGDCRQLPKALSRNEPTERGRKMRKSEILIHQKKSKLLKKETMSEGKNGMKQEIKNRFNQCKV